MKRPVRHSQGAKRRALHARKTGPRAGKGIPAAGSNAETGSETDAGNDGWDGDHMSVARYMDAAEEAASEKPDETPPEPAHLPVPAAEQDDDEDDAATHMSLREHLFELRNRLVRCIFSVVIGFVAVFYFAPKIRAVVTASLREVLPAGGDITFVQLTEPFLVDMHIAFVVGFFLVSPYIFYQVWAFIAPGLYASERRYVVPLAVCCALFFLAGGTFCFMVVLPFTFKFFVTYGQDSAKPLITLAGMYQFSLKLILAFGCMFEMPLFAFFLAKLRIVTAERLRAWRKYAILAMFVVAALITPPDVLSQLLMAGPLILLYELSILVAKFAAPRRQSETKA